jgi:hypothetical protein
MTLLYLVAVLVVVFGILSIVLAMRKNSRV